MFSDSNARRKNYFSDGGFQYHWCRNCRQGYVDFPKSSTLNKTSKESLNQIRVHILPARIEFL